MVKTNWIKLFKPKIKHTKCEQLGVCNCKKDNVMCGNKIVNQNYQRDNAKEYMGKVKVL